MEYGKSTNINGNGLWDPHNPLRDLGDYSGFGSDRVFWIWGGHLILYFNFKQVCSVFGL